MTTFTTGRAHIAPRTTTYFVATTTAYTPHPESGAWTVYVECTHRHTTPDAADACGEKLRRHIERTGTCPAWANDDGHLASVTA